MVSGEKYKSIEFIENKKNDFFLKFETLTLFSILI